MADTPSAPKKTKKFPFKPTALNRKKAAPKSKPEGGADGNDEEEDDLFRRSGQMMPRLQADMERAYRKHQERERRHSSQGGRAKATSSTPSSKRSRDVWSMTAVDELTTAGEEALSSPKEDKSNEPPSRLGPALSPSPSRQKPVPQRAEPPAAARDTDSSDEDLYSASVGPSSPRRPSTSQTSIPAWQSTPSRSTRARSAQQSRDDATPQPSANAADSTHVIVPLDSEPEDAAPPAKRRRSNEVVALNDAPDVAEEEEEGEEEEEEEEEEAEKEKEGEEEEKVDDELDKWIRRAERDNLEWDEETENGTALVYVLSHIEGVQPFKAKYLFTKPMSLLRDAWLQKNNHLSAEDKEDVFLTWNLQRVYNTTDLRGLGIRLSGGWLTTKTGSLKGLDRDKNTVRMEMWTPALFSQASQEAERQRRRLAGEISGDDDDAAPEPEPEPETKLKVTLKAKDMEDLGSTVRPGTVIGTLVEYFRAQRGIREDQEVRILFDGEVLDEDETMEGAEIDDMDVLEVHVR